MTRPAIIPGLCSVTFRTLAPADVVKLATHHGVRAIEWGGDVHVPLGDIAAAKSVAALCAAAGIACPSYGSYVRAGNADAQDRFADAVATAKALGATNIRVWAGSEAGDSADAQSWDKAVNDLQVMSDLAAIQGLTVSLEYHRNTLTEHVGDAEKLLTRVGSDACFTYWQPVPGRGLAVWQDEIKRLTPWMGYFHVFHWVPAGAKDARRPLAEGEDDWHALFGRWTQADHWPSQPIAFLEFVANDSPDQFAADMEVLNRLCAGRAAA